MKKHMKIGLLVLLLQGRVIMSADAGSIEKIGRAERSGSELLSGHDLETRLKVFLDGRNDIEPAKLKQYLNRVLEDAVLFDVFFVQEFRKYPIKEKFEKSLKEVLKERALAQARNPGDALSVISKRGKLDLDPKKFNLLQELGFIPEFSIKDLVNAGIFLRLTSDRRSGFALLLTFCNLTELDLESLPDTVKDNLSKVTFLDLSYNSLKSIPLVDIFRKMPNLKKLDLVGNSFAPAEQERIKRLIKNVFKSDCKVRFVKNQK